MKSAQQLALRLFGGFALDRDGQPCKIAYEKGRGLIAFLAVEPGRDHLRTSLASMLWPDLARDAALSNLRLVLHNLRQALAGPDPDMSPLHVSRELVRLDRSPGFRIDADEFSLPDRKCPSSPCPEVCTPCLAEMETLATLYRGEFMAGFSLPDCPEFEEWLQVRREALHLRALTLLARLADCHERSGNHAGSLPFALRFLELEPWNEQGLRRAMRLLTLTGQQAAALSQYEASRRILKRDLGVLPSEETRALAERIRQGELSPTARRRDDMPQAAVLPPPMAEKRQVTVLYCELTPLDAEDPDDALKLLREPQAHCSEIIRDRSGYLVQIRGGSLLAYFGYPQASESAARLAVQAALTLARTEFDGLELRVAVHTGMVISGGPQIPDSIGATSGLAIRLRQMADSAEVAISAATQLLVAGYFECSSLGAQRFPGLSRPLEVFRVNRESGAQSRLEAAATLAPLVGRKNEIAALRNMWRDAAGGERRMVLLRGEAGIGKSRLVHALKESLRDESRTTRELRCLPEHSQSPFYPLTALFGATLGFSPDDSAEARFDRLADFVEANYAKANHEVVPLLATMLSLPVRAPYRESVSSPQQQRERLLAILLDRLYELASRQPVLLLAEDLNWADPSTLELLTMFVSSERTLPMLAVFTSRPDFEPPWDPSRVHTMTLDALDEAETAALVATVAPGLAPATANRIVERADGIPLFAEELARRVADDDLAAIPSTLQDLLAARLDGMGRAKVAAQAAATIGREFSFDLLRQVTPFDEAGLSQLLLQLQAAGIVLSGGGAGFHFKHALMRDAAYQSQTRVEREASHRRIAAALQTAGGDVRPELLAQHWTAGGEIREAIGCWTAAGKLAGRHSASQEALMHFKSGLAVVDALPEDEERVRLELELQIDLGAAACAAQGYASAEGAEAYARAVALCSRHEGGPDMFRAVWGLWASASSRTGYPEALTLAKRLLHIADQGDDLVQKQQAAFAVGNTLFWQGEFGPAREHLERVAESYLPTHHQSHVAEFGEDAGVTSTSYLSWVLWFLGHPDRARDASARAIALARQLGHPYSLAYALTFAAILHCRLRRPDTALELAQETLALAGDHGFPLWQIGGTLSRGWALAMQNRPEGIETLRQCIEATRAAMGGVTLVVLEPLLDAHLLLGRFDAVPALSEQALTVGGTLGDHHIEGELLRLKGEALLAMPRPAPEDAAACFQRALAISRRQRAKSLELRAAMSLARLLRAQGECGEARRVLETVYRTFSEGFSTPDLRDAGDLLTALGGTATA